MGFVYNLKLPEYAVLRQPDASLPLSFNNQNSVFKSTVV